MTARIELARELAENALKRVKGYKREIFAVLFLGSVTVGAGLWIHSDGVRQGEARGRASELQAARAVIVGQIKLAAAERKKKELAELKAAAVADSLRRIRQKTRDDAVRAQDAAARARSRVAVLSDSSVSIDGAAPVAAPRELVAVVLTADSSARAAAADQAAADKAIAAGVAHSITEQSLRAGISAERDFYKAGFENSQKEIKVWKDAKAPRFTFKHGVGVGAAGAALIVIGAIAATR